MLKKEEIKNVMDSCTEGAWYGTKSKRSFESKLGTKLIFSGRMDEPLYQEFSTTCDVVLVKNGSEKILFSKTDRSIAPFKKEAEIVGSIENIENVLKKENFYEV